VAAPPTELIAQFIDAVVEDHPRAKTLLTTHPELLNARWTWDATVLHFCVVEGFIEGVKFLAQHGADVNSVNKYGDAPLVNAATLGHTEIADILLRHGADPNARDPITGNTALHCAAEHGNDTLVALLLTAGADPRYRTGLDETVFDVLPLAGPERERVIAVLATHGIVLDNERE